MENKKPLILIPPFSEPMTKLKEVLEGVAQEENIEIFTVEDAKEFGQLLGSGGQALVMVSNAKVCATLLQENKAIISKNHSKVILLTPKEIPVKTLEKFRKIGLTESILESTAPKTLLYKVKLQLKSIKLATKEDNTQQLVKTMLDNAPKTKVAEDLILDASSEKNSEQPEENISTEKARKTIAVDDGENLDYLSNLKGKKTMQEEAIETHWKSKREKTENLDSDEEDFMKTKKDSQSINDIDMYYRGKKKKDEMQVEEAEDLYKRNKIEAEEEAEEYKKKKNVIEEIELEAARKKPVSLEEENDDLYDRKFEKEEPEAEAEKKKKEKFNPEEELDIEALQKKLLEQLEEGNKNDLSNDGVEDLGGHLKGKVNNQLLAEEEDEGLKQEAPLEEGIVNEKRKKDIVEEAQLDDIESKKKELEAAEDKDPHEGEVDQIETYMRGDINKTDTIDTLMEAESDSKKETLDEVSNDDDGRKKKESLDAEEEIENRKKEKIEDIDLEDGDLKQEALLDEDNGKDLRQEKLQELEEGEDFNRSAAEKTEELEEDNRRARLKLDENDKEMGQRSSTKKEEEDLNRRDVDNNKLKLEEGNERNVHEGQTDKISTYYRSGENKDKDQDWDLKQDKKSTKLDIEKTKKEDIDLGKLKKSQTGEEVIDYRKLKEEFDLIAKGELNPDGTYSGSGVGPDGRPRDIKDSFKVIEVGPTPFDFAVQVLTELYNPDTKPKDILKMVGEKLLSDEKCLMTTHQISPKDKRYSETFSAYLEFSNQVSDTQRTEWNLIKENEENKTLFNSFTMPTWICREIPDNGTFWRDIELPTWAGQELTNKKVELVYPFFDGVERLGYAHLFFPEGINPAHDKKIIISVEMMRSIFLENAIKISRPSANDNSENNETVEERGKNNVLNFFGGLFGNNKKAS